MENNNKEKNGDLKNVLNINNNKNSTRFSEENILNIINSTEGASNKKTEIELSNSTQKLIDKYINIDLNSNHKEIKNLKNNNVIEMADNAILSPSFVNMNNGVGDIDNVQKMNTNNEDELLNGENSIIKINNLLLENNDKEKMSLIDLSERENINNKINIKAVKNETNINNDNNKMNKKGNNKYNPKSAALKKLIDKI